MLIINIHTYVLFSDIKNCPMWYSNRLNMKFENQASVFQEKKKVLIDETGNMKFQIENKELVKILIDKYEIQMF